MEENIQWRQSANENGKQSNLIDEQALTYKLAEPRLSTLPMSQISGNNSPARVSKLASEDQFSPVKARANFQEYNHIFKFIMLGSTYAGKTSLVIRFSQNTFSDAYLNTVGVDLKSATLKIYDTYVRINLWDTTGQEKFRSLTTQYYRQSHGAIAVFDLTDAKSLDHLQHQIREFRAYCPAQAVSNIILVGNKVDLINERRISKETALQVATELGISDYFETSASSNIQVDDAFFTSAIKAYKIENLQESGGDFVMQMSNKSQDGSILIKNRKKKTDMSSIKLQSNSQKRKTRNYKCCK